jgi:hypothetical protein
MSCLDDKRFDREWKAIEDSDMLPEEKREAYRELERDYGEAVQQLMYEEEREALDRKYGR